MSTSAPPLATTVGADLYAALEPLAYADAALGWPLAHYVSAIGLILEDAAVLVRADDEGHDGWSAFADPDRCPDSYLYTLAQWAGVRYPHRMSLTDLRDLIGPHAPGVWRGTKDAILASVRRYLAQPDGLLYFEERADGDPYKLRIFTYTFDTLDQAAIEIELLNVVPAGLIVNYEVREGASWAQLHASSGTWGAVNTNYATWRDVAIAPLG